ncbi:methyltransferase family protein [Halopolyspora algeriensis]|uniref:Methyltransferase family protein n=1 Tax=Halopolyspora algeriensis TaxID=1500506 RepID=A0A368VQP3_9ACTN|nr:class I SAM-dependent methyltransferase [Halopolyspora algeriensis]RCW43182.1 methyltransferase family protein [Halopolyspora algeriensis]TQM56240.1 methyltransferase family protein [Halopolyspora algeriensis]
MADQGAFERATGRNLEDDSGKPRYLRYQRNLMLPHCGRSVLEVGAGTGEFASHVTGLERYVLTDVDPDAAQYMKQRFAGRPEVEVRTLDLDEQPKLEQPVETAMAINVLEHIDDDATALRSLSRLVTPGGTIVLWVPGYQQLYGEFDRLVGHVRRYTPETMRSAIQRAGLTVRLAKPVNFLGALAWWAAVRKGGSNAPNKRLVRIYDRFVVPVTEATEKVVPAPFGQSILGVAQVPAD